jgi:pimeloyl-ACP methyl ester carboxylesterase
MTIDRPIHFFREQGEGTAVICLHSNASTSSQWRALGEALCERFRVIAVDGYGAGKSPPWPAEVAMRLDDEVRLLEAVLGRAGERFHLVGHSYGAAVAIKMALTYPKRVRSVAIYEPTLFHLVADGDPPASPAAGIWQAATDAAEAVDAGNNDASRQAAVADSVRNVRGWRDALFNEALSPSNLALLTTPVLCLWGEDSPESSLSVVRSLCALLPKVTCAPLPGLGYMGPITHPELVNARIGEFLSRH